MADEQTEKGAGGGLNRRNFLKSAGVVVTGSTLGAGMTLSGGMAAAAAPVSETLTHFRCPLCSEDFGTFAELQNHFATAHPKHVLPVTTKLQINGKDCEVLIEPHWTS